MSRKASSASIYNWDAKYLNNATFLYYATMLADIATTCFKWKNLPKSVDERYIERLLFNTGRAYFFDDPIIGHLCLGGAPQLPYDQYDNPTKVTIIANNGYTHSTNDFVPLYNNFSRMPSIGVIQLFARRLMELERTIDVNIAAQKTPMLFICESESERLAIRNAMQQYTGNEPYMTIKGNFSNNLKPFPPANNFIGDKLMMTKRQILSEAYTYLGIYSNAQEKKERLVALEIEAANDSSNATEDMRLVARQKAAELINEKYKLNISVERRRQQQYGNLYDYAENDMRRTSESGNSAGNQNN